MAKRLALVARSIVVVLALVVVVVGLPARWLGFIGPSWVRFQSSDGKWADETVPTKGRDFVVILRTTPQPAWFQLEYWFNDYDDPEWRVPYVAALPIRTTGKLPSECANKGVPPKLAPIVVRSFDEAVGTVCRAHQTTKLSVARYGALPEGAVLIVEYPAASGNPAARDIWCETERADWSAGHAIAFQVNAEHDMRLSVSFVDRNGVAYTSWAELSAHAWQRVRLPFDRIRPNPYFQPPDAKTGAPIDVSEVTRIGFAPQDPGAGVVSIGRFVVDY